MNKKNIEFTFCYILLLLSFCIVLNPQIILNKYYSHSMNIEKGFNQVQICSEYNSSEINKLYCINDFVKDNFKYKITKLPISEKELLLNGGDCKVWSFYYGSLLDEMNITYKYIELPNHIYLMAYSEDYYCNIDMENIDCKFSRGVEE